MKLSEIPARLVGTRKKVWWSITSFILVFEIVSNIALGFFQVEADAGLALIIASQHGHYQSYGEFTEDFGELPVGFDETYKYTFFVSPTEHEGRPLEELGLSDPVDFESLGIPEPGLTEEGFVVVAVGEIDLDDGHDIWWADETGNQYNIRCDVFSIYRLVIVYLHYWYGR